MDTKLMNSTKEEFCESLYELQMAANSMSTRGGNDSLWAGKIYQQIENALRLACQDAYGSASPYIMDVIGQYAGEKWSTIVKAGLERQEGWR